jgi:hypothetical protein
MICKKLFALYALNDRQACLSYIESFWKADGDV